MSYFLTHAAKGKRAVFWTLLCFAAVQLALWAYLDCRHVAVRDPLYGVRLRSLQSLVSDSPNAPLVLVLGSSRVKYGLRPAAMQVTSNDGPPPVIYNFGLNGMGTIRERMYFRRLLADGVHPDWLLLEVWPPLWAEAGYFKEARMVRHEDELHWRDAPLVYRYFLREPEVYLWGMRKCLVPLLAYRTRLLHSTVRSLLPRPQVRRLALGMKDWDPADRSGWFPFPWERKTPEEKRIALEQGNEQLKPLLDPLHIDPRSDDALRGLLDECRARGIRVGLVLMPEHSLTRGWYTPQARALIRDYLAGLDRAYHIPIFDTREWVADKDFADFCHMMPQAAAPFSQRFGREIIQPLLQSQAPTRNVLFRDTAP